MFSSFFDVLVFVEIKNRTSKNREKKLVGLPLFKQIIDLFQKRSLILHGLERYYKTFDSWTQLVTMLFGVLSRCDFMGERCDAMRGLEGKLNYFGMDRSPYNSTTGGGLRGRYEAFFKDVDFILLEHFKSFLSVSRIDNTSFAKLFIFDSVCKMDRATG